MNVTLSPPRSAQIVTARLRGPLFMLAAALAFALLNILIKLLDERFRIWDLAFYRFAGGLVILALAFAPQNPFKGRAPRLLFLRGLAGCASFLALVGALHLLPLSTTLVVFYSFPAFAAAYSSLLFREPIGKIEAVTVLGGLLGVAILLDFRLQQGVLGQLLALMAAALAGLAVSLIRKLRQENGPVVIYLYLCLVGSLVCCAPFLSNPQLPTTAPEVLMLVGIVIFSLAAQLLMNQGFRDCKSWEGGSLLMAEVVFTTAFGILCLREEPTWRFWVGAGMIILSGLLLSRATAKGEETAAARPLPLAAP